MARRGPGRPWIGAAYSSVEFSRLTFQLAKTQEKPMPESRRIDALLAQYCASHRDPTNQLIHLVCVPGIVFALLGLLWAAHPLAAGAATLGALRYYFQLSQLFAKGMAAMLGAMLILLLALPQETILPLALAIAVLAWAAQFIGHMIEGRQPTMRERTRNFLTGPLFVLSFLYRRFKLDH
jgi:uncharacterized membrane protein YGL010W